MCYELAAARLEPGTQERNTCRLVWVARTRSLDHGKFEVFSPFLLSSSPIFLPFTCLPSFYRLQWTETRELTDKKLKSLSKKYSLTPQKHLKWHPAVDGVKMEEDGDDSDESDEVDMTRKKKPTYQRKSRPGPKPTRLPTDHTQRSLMTWFKTVDAGKEVAEGSDDGSDEETPKPVLHCWESVLQEGVSLGV